MDGSGLARIAAIIFVSVAITAAVMEMSREELGEAAASDADCLAVWAETRDRFLGRDTGSDPAGSE